MKNDDKAMKILTDIRQIYKKYNKKWFRKKTRAFVMSEQGRGVKTP